MNTELCPGDLVTGRNVLFDHCPDSITQVLLARPAGTSYWTLRLPRFSIMTVVEPPARRNVNEPIHVTVLAEEQLVEVFFADVERIFGVEQ